VNAIATGARTVALVIIIGLAAAAGVLAGNAMQNRLGADQGAGLGGFVPQNRGGSVVAVDEYLDFALRHRAPAEEYLDYALRHRQADVANAPASVTTPTPR
jgi:hypothetical protein